MEDYLLVILILGAFFGSVFSAIWYKKQQNPVKKSQKRNESSLFDNLTEYREVEKGTILDILKQKDNQIKSLNARIKQFEPIVEEDQPNKGVSFEEIQQLANQLYPKYAAMLPLMKKQVMEMSKGMSKQDIINYIGQITGNKQSQGSTEELGSQPYRQDWA